MIPAAVCTPDDVSAVLEYERLRANALGETNRSFGFALFLRAGMTAWLCCMPHSTESDEQTSRSPSPMDAGMTEAGPIAAILVDAFFAQKPLTTIEGVHK